MARTNSEIFGAPIDLAPAKRAQRTMLDGRVISVVPLDAVAHAETLYEGSRGEENEGLCRKPRRRTLCSLSFLTDATR
jgi:hypothetical protein